VIDAFRTYGGVGISLGDVEERQTTSNLGIIKRTRGFSLKELAKISYYSILMGYRKNDLETKMLLNLGKSSWESGFKLKDCKHSDDDNLRRIEEIGKIAEKYATWIEGEINKPSKEVYLDSVGKYNPRDHLENTVEELVTDNLNQCLTSMVNNLVF
jgi:26S proteasome regulatory subunit N11